MNNKLFICILIFGGSLLISSCKSYELRPEAQNILFSRGYSSLLMSIKNNSKNQNSVFSNCKNLGYVSTEKDDFWRSRATTQSERENDLKNQAAIKGANVLFCDSSKDCYSGEIYHCENLNSVIAAQREIDEREAQELKATREKEEKELYSKPHHWVTCIATGYSQMPPSIVQSMLEKNFPPKAFDSENVCADNASYLTQVGSQFGIQCKCKYLKMNR